ncbi:MAG: DnaJ domain-containing protein [Methylobacteriaceae bacterium]|nr:DnaJ domain-containing protein [Methylobacteriaceae bacterium]
MPLIAGFLLLFLLIWGLRGFTRVPPALLAKFIRRFGGMAGIAIGLFLIVRGAVEAGMAVLGASLWLLGFFNLKGPIGFRSVGKGRRASGMSRVRSAMIEMELDHATGALNGTILAGALEGRALSSLTRTQCDGLWRLCRTDDPDGARLLEPYLDRRFPGWGETRETDADAGRSTGGDRRSRRPGKMTEEEAYEVLGLSKGATRDDVARAHRTLMKKLHPDYGGSTDLAARVNEAKEILLRRHT